MTSFLRSVYQRIHCEDLHEIISTNFETQINSLIGSLRTYFPEEAIGDNIVRLRGIVENSDALADEVFHAHDAEKWGNGL
jgi:hypothetical protein